MLRPIRSKARPRAAAEASGAAGVGDSNPGVVSPKDTESACGRRKYHACIGESQTMSKKSMNHTTAPSTKPDDQMMALAEESGATVSALVEAGNAIVESWMRLSQELVEFSSARWHEQIELSQRLLGCNDPGAAFDMQCELARSASQQYFDEAAKLMGLAAEVAQASWAPLETRTKQALGRLKTDE